MTRPPPHHPRRREVRHGSHARSGTPLVDIVVGLRVRLRPVAAVPPATVGTGHNTHPRRRPGAVAAEPRPVAMTDDRAGNVEAWRRVVAEHVPAVDDRRRCARCGGYWPCWELAYAREQLIINGAG